MARRPVDGGHVQHSVAAFHELRGGSGVAEIALDQARRGGTQALRHRPRPDQHRHLVAARPQGFEQATAGVAGRPRQRDAHAFNPIRSRMVQRV